MNDFSDEEQPHVFSSVSPAGNREEASGGAAGRGASGSPPLGGTVGVGGGGEQDPSVM